DRGELAQLTGYSEAQIVSWERGRARLYPIELIKLCHALDVMPEWLLCWERRLLCAAGLAFSTVIHLRPRIFVSKCDCAQTNPSAKGFIGPISGPEFTSIAGPVAGLFVFPERGVRGLGKRPRLVSALVSVPPSSSTGYAQGVLGYCRRGWFSLSSASCNSFLA